MWILCLPKWEGRGEARGCCHPHTSTACWVHTLPPSHLPGGGEAPHPEHIKCKYYKHYFRFLVLFCTCHQSQLPQDGFCPSVPFYRDMSSCCLCSLLPFVLVARFSSGAYKIVQVCVMDLSYIGMEPPMSPWLLFLEWGLHAGTLWLNIKYPKAATAVVDRFLKNAFSWNQTNFSNSNF